jgi:hypothetical protein
VEARRAGQRLRSGGQSEHYPASVRALARVSTKIAPDRFFAAIQMPGLSFPDLYRDCKIVRRDTSLFCSFYQLVKYLFRLVSLS